MKVVGITGGISSGKSYVSNLLKDKYPVFFFDEEAKNVYFLSDVKGKIISLLGEKAYIGDKLNTKYIAEKVFSDNKLLDRINSIIYPALAEHFNSWLSKQKSDIVFAEAALFVESGFVNVLDKLIYVYSPLIVRLERWKKRERTENIELFFSRARKQIDAIKLFHYADFIIFNDTICNVRKQLDKILEELL